MRLAVLLGGSWLAVHGFSATRRVSPFGTKAARRPSGVALRASEGPLDVQRLILESQPSDRSGDLGVGEDAATFKWENEKWGALGDRGWLTFGAAVGTILSALVVLWILPATGYSDDFQHWLEDLCHGDSHLVTLAFGVIFPVVHSGLASLRPLGEKVVGARTWRVIFAWPSLCLSYSWITYFIAHAHDGIVLWDGEHVAAAHAAAWLVSFASFFFLYPTVFNLKEVAAVEVPKLHLWETGVIRITRHPQFVGQFMWSAAHLAMVGSSFNFLTMSLLVGHHAFACWNGDRRLYDEHGDDFLAIKERTSTVPGLAILEGRQQLPPDVYKEFLRAPYALIAVGTVGAYFAHPYMQAGAALYENAGLVPGGVLNVIFQ
ncbi:NnrU protein-domain-containing protein [Pelagophyceae sp. CCMP2097]|nr:NnrU protein-domain-containing protein [Pelagophyceae sp. CCMP2097]